MDPRTNPYVPGAGVRPPAFSWREGIVETVDIAYDRIRNGLHANSMILLGLRGVGKTVLLNRLNQDAKTKGFQTIKFEVPDGSGRHLAKQMVPTSMLCCAGWTGCRQQGLCWSAPGLRCAISHPLLPLFLCRKTLSARYGGTGDGLTPFWRHRCGAWNHQHGGGQHTKEPDSRRDDLFAAIR